MVEKSILHNTLEDLRDSQEWDTFRSVVFDSCQDIRALANCLIELADDQKRVPCGINHTITDIITDTCRAHPEWLHGYADEISRQLESQSTPDDAKKVLCEVVDKLNWYSWHERKEHLRQEIPHFSDLLSQRVEPSSLIANLRQCACINAQYVPPQFGYVMPLDSNLSMDIPLERFGAKEHTTLRYLNQGRYYIEINEHPVNENLVGYLEAYFVTSSHSVYLDIHIFYKRDTRRGIGKSIMKWAAEWVGQGNYVEIIYPALSYHYSLIRSLCGEGVFNKIEAIQSDVKTAMNIPPSSDWKEIQRNYSIEGIEQKLQEERLFIRGRVK